MEPQQGPSAKTRVDRGRKREQKTKRQPACPTSWSTWGWGVGGIEPRGHIKSVKRNEVLARAAVDQLQTLCLVDKPATEVHRLCDSTIRKIQNRQRQCIQYRDRGRSEVDRGWASGDGDCGRQRPRGPSRKDKSTLGLERRMVPHGKCP